jgi:Ras-related protein Rab-6A
MSESVRIIGKFKVLFLGDTNVGKTYIIKRFIYESFDINCEPTIGMHLFAKNLYLDDRDLKFQFFDSCGQEGYNIFITESIDDISLAVIVFDVTNKETFYNCDKWVEDLRNHQGNTFAIILVGNKIDKDEERVVSVDEAMDKAMSLESMYFETNSYTGDSVKLFFQLIVAALPKDKLRLAVNA